MIAQLLRFGSKLAAIGVAATDDPDGDLEAIRALVDENVFVVRAAAAQDRPVPELGDSVWRQLVDEHGGAAAYQQMLSALDTAERDLECTLRWTGVLCADHPVAS